MIGGITGTARTQQNAARRADGVLGVAALAISAAGAATGCVGIADGRGAGETAAGAVCGVTLAAGPRQGARGHTLLAVGTLIVTSAGLTRRRIASSTDGRARTTT